MARDRQLETASCGWHIPAILCQYYGMVWFGLVWFGMGWIIVRWDLIDCSIFHGYNIAARNWSFERIEGRMKTNFCTVKKQEILQYSSGEPDQGDGESLLERYFGKLSQQKA